MTESSVELKGSLFTLSVLKLTDTDLERSLDALSEKIAQVPKFFDKAPIVVDLERIQEAAIDFAALRSGLADLNLVPVGISNGSEQQKLAARNAGFSCVNGGAQRTVAAKPVADTPAPNAVPEPIAAKTLTVESHIRSGQQVYAKDADLIILGSVSNGAEVIADGNIHIYGSLRGRAIAGAKGDSSARIYCQNLQPELVSVCGQYWLSDALQQHWKKSAVIALRDDKLALTELN